MEIKKDKKVAKKSPKLIPKSKQVNQTVPKTNIILQPPKRKMKSDLFEV